MEPQYMLTFGQRLRAHRERAGKSRTVLGGLVGRSAEWVKAVESGRLLQPRLPMLLRLADALGIDDLSALTGTQSLPVNQLTKIAHPGLEPVREAMIGYGLRIDAPPVDVLAQRVAAAWAAWHTSAENRSAVAPLLPDLILDCRSAARGEDRRQALIVLAKAYNLTQAYLAFQSAPELVAMAADRALAAAYEADDPEAIAGAAWYAEQYQKSVGQPEMAAQIALDAIGVLPGLDAEDPRLRACFGLVQLSAAEAYAGAGEEGRAWRHWDQADRALGTLDTGYVHPWLMFGRGVVENYSILLDVELFRADRAIQRLNQVDLETIPSRTRRAVQRVNHARAYALNGENFAVLHLVQQAHWHSPETVRFRPWVRETVLSLTKSGGPSVQGSAVEVAGSLGILD
jgi:transcriptional regulator with XRE-family HTH domain